MAKKNTNKKQKGGKKKAEPRRQVPRGVKGGGGSHALAKAVCSNLNAFCPEAKGAKVFDSNSEPSQTFQSRTMLNVTTNASGQAAYYFSSSPAYAWAVGTLSGNSVASWTNYNNTFYTSRVDDVSLYRVVSWGVRFKATEPSMTAKGIMLAVGCGTRNEALNVSQSVNSLNQGYSADFTPVRDASIEIMGKPYGDQANFYIEIGSDMPGWSTSMFLFSGCSESTNIGTFEYIVNYEFSSVATTGLNQNATHAAPSVPDVLTVRGNTAASRPFMTKFVDAVSADHSWMKSVESNLNSAGAMISAVGNLYTPLKALGGMMMGGSAALRLMN